MIRTVNRLGLVTAGAGGNAGDYSFDSDGLSNDPRLAYYLQSLTPSQLQAALDGQAPTAADILGPSYSLTTCEQNYDPTICGPGGPTTTNPLAMSLGFNLPSLSSLPTWAKVAGAAGAVVLVLALMPGKR